MDSLIQEEVGPFPRSPMERYPWRISLRSGFWCGPLGQFNGGIRCEQAFHGESCSLPASRSRWDCSRRWPPVAARPIGQGVAAASNEPPVVAAWVALLLWRTGRVRPRRRPRRPVVAVAIASPRLLHGLNHSARTEIRASRFQPARLGRLCTINRSLVWICLVLRCRLAATTARRSSVSGWTRVLIETE